MKAVGNNVVIQQDAAEDKSPGGIVIPNEQAPNRGAVVSASAETGVVCGDTVYYRGGWTIEHEGSEYVVVDANDVLCKI